HPPLTLSCAGVLRALPSFPTRRSSDLGVHPGRGGRAGALRAGRAPAAADLPVPAVRVADRAGRGRAEQLRPLRAAGADPGDPQPDRKSTRLNSSHVKISYAVFCLKKKT